MTKITQSGLMMLITAGKEQCAIPLPRLSSKSSVDDYSDALGFSDKEGSVTTGGGVVWSGIFAGSLSKIGFE